MTPIRYLHLDVFAASHGGGNHLGVVTDARGWNDARMQRFARWNNLVETTFLLPPDDPKASYRVRIFTPHKEIPFAGHPSIGSAHAALECGLAAPVDGLLWQECGAGVLPIRVEGNGADRRLLLQSPGERVLETGHDAHPLLGAALSGIGSGILPPALVDGGRRWWLAEVERNRPCVRGNPTTAPSAPSPRPATAWACAPSRASRGRPVWMAISPTTSWWCAPSRLAWASSKTRLPARPTA